MLRLRQWLTSLMMAALVLCAAGTGTAETLEIPLATHAVITNGASRVRNLLKFADLSPLAGKRILYAKLLLNVQFDSCVTSERDLEVKLLSRTWDPTSVTWESPWDSAGGDVVAGLVRHTTVPPGPEGNVEVLLTEIVQGWVDGRFPDCGFLLVPHAPECSYALTTREDFPAKGYGKLVVSFVAKEP